MSWKARLNGHSFDLDTLASLFRECEPTVGRDKDGFFLKSSAFEGPSVTTDIHERAGRLLNHVNGVARALDPSYRPVQLEGQYVSEEGHQSAFIEAVTIEARAQMVTPIVEGDPSPPPPPRGPKYLALASTDPNVAEALRYLTSDLDALRLRKAYEVIKDDVGGEHELVNKGLAASKGVLDRFRAPLISQDVSGDDALHARSKRKAVKNDMDLSEARGFLLGLALRWMDSKLPPS